MEKRMKAEQDYAELMRRVREASIVESCAGLLGWDERTQMPQNGSAHRAEQMALLARMRHEMVTDSAVGDLLASVQDSPLIAGPESDVAVNVREVRRDYDRAVK